MFGIQPNRMFSSRNTRFAEQIRRETGGRGVDVILNSLIGELLDESWRLTADGGVMVEIGKRDIVDRNTLAMEPFDRNCSFRAVDLSYTREISDQLIGKYVATYPLFAPPFFSQRLIAFCQVTKRGFCSRGKWSCWAHPSRDCV
jgi:hypothetical protein